MAIEIVFQPVTFGIYTSLKSKKKTVRLSWRHFRFPDQACLPSGPPPPGLGQLPDPAISASAVDEVHEGAIGQLRVRRDMHLDVPARAIHPASFACRVRLPAKNAPSRTAAGSRAVEVAACLAAKVRNILLTRWAGTTTGC